MMTRAALTQEKVQQRRIGAGLRGRTKPGMLQSSLVLLRSRTSGGASVTQHARSFAASVERRRTLRDVDRTYLRSLKRARRLKTSC
jgi:hypothetical protein